MRLAVPMRECPFHAASEGAAFAVVAEPPVLANLLSLASQCLHSELTWWAWLDLAMYNGIFHIFRSRAFGKA
jgi:hypothetical protein